MIRIDTLPREWSGPATITRQAEPGRYLATDDSGRSRLVRTGETWRAGDRVRAIAGVVVGRAGRSGTATVYEV